VRYIFKLLIAAITVLLGQEPRRYKDINGLGCCSLFHESREMRRSGQRRESERERKEAMSVNIQEQNRCHAQMWIIKNVLICRI
jgi:hypothetical protein